MSAPIILFSVSSGPLICSINYLLFTYLIQQCTPILLSASSIFYTYSSKFTHFQSFHSDHFLPLILREYFIRKAEIRLSSELWRSFIWKSKESSLMKWSRTRVVKITMPIFKQNLTHSFPMQENDGVRDDCQYARYHYKCDANLVLQERSKHIDVKYHYLRDLTNNGVINLIYCRSKDQVADIFTKSLKIVVFQRLRRLLGVCSFGRSISLILPSFKQNIF